MRRLNPRGGATLKYKYPCPHLAIAYMNMKKKEQKKKEYQIKAKYFVDTLFDNNLLNPKLSRDGLDALEAVVAFEYQSFADSNRRMLEFTEKFDKWKKKAQTK